jgi:predicted ATPase/DNA-binding SARP family transcriptional activator/Tfp pilus assembly protein PilF
VIRLCGGLTVEAGGKSLEQKVPPGQATLLFAYLVVNRAQRVSREDLVEALWPGGGPKDPQAVLSTLLSRLRHAVAPIEIDGKSELRVVLPEPAWVDVEAARTAVDDALRAQEAGDWAAAYEHARDAISLVALDMLPGGDSPWLEELRREIGGLTALALESVARSAVAGRGANLSEGKRAAQALVSKAPFRETGYRLLMEVLEASGDVAEALQVYDELRTVLRDELGAVPAANVQALHGRLLGGGRPREAGPHEATRGLPAARTSFVGRVSEARDIRRRVLDGRAVTIVGAGGMGKTRLALRTAEQIDAQLDEGSWLVELAPIAEPELVLQAVASVLGIRQEPDRELAESLTHALADRELCVVLDNCEQVLPAARMLADALLAACPRVRLIATSREPLDYAGESVLQLDPLPTPDGDEPTTVAESDAVELFRQRAVAAAADFRLTSANAGTVAGICRRLDGMPLALELAAALVSVLGVAEIGERLDERLRLTMAGASTTPDRHRTLGALVEWSHDLLDETERSLFRRLAVFHGGFTLAAAEHVCVPEAVGVLPGLVRKSLVVKEEKGERARYRMLETIRQFAAVKLEASGEWTSRRAAHLSFYRELAELGEPGLADGMRQVDLLDDLESELDNFREAIRAGLEDGADCEAALTTAASLFTLWYVRGHMTEGRRWLDSCVGVCAGAAPESRAKALAASGELAREQGDYAAARSHLTESLAIARETGVAVGYGGSAFSLFNLGCIAWEQGGYREAQRLLEESLELLPEGAHPGGGFDRAWPLLKLGQVALEQGNAGQATMLFEQSLSRHRRRGDREGLARALEQLARAALASGDTSASRLLSERSLEAAGELGYKEGVLGPLLNLARIDLAEGSCDGALASARQALAIADQLGSKRGIAAAIETLACSHAARADAERALQLFGAASAIRDEIGSPVPGHLRHELDAAIGAARERPTRGMAAATWAAGVSMTRDQAVAFAAGA